jgi:hypothetical protein
MIILSIILLILSNTTTLKRDQSNLYSRATITILLIVAIISYDNINFLFLNKGIDLFGGLFHATPITLVFHIFILLISAVTLSLTAFYPRKVWFKKYFGYQVPIFYLKNLKSKGIFKYIIFFKVNIIIFWFLFITWLFELNLLCGISSVFLTICIIKHIFMLKQESYYSWTHENLLLLIIEIITVYHLTDQAIPDEFYSSYPNLSNMHISMFYAFLGQTMLNVIYGNPKRYNYGLLKNKLKEIWLSSNKSIIRLFRKGIGLLAFLFLFNLVSNLIGVSINPESLLLYIVTILAKFTLLRLILSIISLPMVKNENDWYNLIGISPFLPILIFPFSYFYFTFILPEVIVLYSGILYKMSTIVANIMEYFSNLNVKELSFINIKVLGQYLVSMGNRPAQVGKFLISLADWVLGNSTESITRKSHSSTEYIPAITMDPLTDMKSKIRGWKYMNSKPDFSPVKIATPTPTGKLYNSNNILYVKGSLNNLYDYFYENYNSLIEFFNLMKYNDVSNITLETASNRIEVSLNEKFSGAEIKVLNSNGKPFNYGFDLLSYLDSSFQKNYMNDVIKNYNKDINVFSQRGSFLPLQNENTPQIARSLSPDMPMESPPDPLDEDTIVSSTNREVIEQIFSDFTGILTDYLDIEKELCQDSSVSNSYFVHKTQIDNYLNTWLTDNAGDPRKCSMIQHMALKYKINWALTVFEGRLYNYKGQLDGMIEALDNGFGELRWWNPSFEESTAAERVVREHSLILADNEEQNIPNSIEQNVDDPLALNIRNDMNKLIDGVVNEDMTIVNEVFSSTPNPILGDDVPNINEGSSNPVNEGSKDPVNEESKDPVNEGSSNPVNEGSSITANKGSSGKRTFIKESGVPKVRVRAVTIVDLVERKVIELSTKRKALDYLEDYELGVTYTSLEQRWLSIIDTKFKYLNRWVIKYGHNHDIDWDEYNNYENRDFKSVKRWD